MDEDLRAEWEEWLTDAAAGLVLFGLMVRDARQQRPPLRAKRAGAPHPSLREQAAELGIDFVLLQRVERGVQVAPDEVLQQLLDLVFPPAGVSEPTVGPAPSQGVAHDQAQAS